jgi:alkylglycerol monooxygenase
MENWSRLDFTAFAVPGFLIFIAIEYFVSRRQKKRYFRFESSVMNLCVGIAERITDILIFGIFYNLFEFIQEHYGIFNIPDNLWTAAVLFIAIDFVWYWYHRLGHEVNILWSAHVIHHQSEAFNYTVSARITVFQAIIRNTFWCVLPLIGFSPQTMSVCLLIHGLYSFFIHTRTIGKLGILEYIFVTPSHHRVHHASNERYLDKNYGDVLIVWDKIFHTFQKETETPVYGLTRQLKSHSFLWQHFHQFLELAYAVAETRGIGEKLRMVFGRPDKISPEIRTHLESIFLSGTRTGKKKNKSSLKYYVIFQLIISLTLLFVLTLTHHLLEMPLFVLGTIFILITLVNCGAILDQRKWAFYPEYSRALLLIVTCGWYFPNPVMVGTSILAAFALSYYFEYAQQKFIVVLYGKNYETAMSNTHKRE